MDRPADKPGRPRWHLLFGLLAISMLVKGLLWTFAIPPFDAPDEPAHYSHAQLLALRGRLPTAGNLDSTSPDVALMVSAILLSVTPGTPEARLYQERGGSGPVGPAEIAAAKTAQQPVSQTPSGSYSPVGYVLYAVPIRLFAPQGIVAQLAGARLVAVLLGTAAVLAVAWAGLEAGLDARMATAAGVIAGYQPMWSQQTAVVTADAALFCFASLFFALMLRTLRRPSRRLGVATAAVLALTLLSKPAGLFALPFAVIFFIPAIRARGRERVDALAVGFGLSLLAALPFVAWNRYRPAGVPPTAGRGTLVQYAHILRDAGFAYPRGLIGQFWGDFGWLEQSLSPGVITGLRYVSLIAVMFCGAALLKRGRGRSGIVLGMAYFVACAAVAFGFDLLLWLNQGGLGVQGRYLLPALGGAAVAVVAALNRLLPRPAATVVGSLVAGGMVVLNFVSLATLSARFFVS